MPVKMGLAASRAEEDEALLLCRERKNFVKQVIDGSCSLASAHTAYLHSLRSTGCALRVFFEAELPIGSPLSASASRIVEPVALPKTSALLLATFTPSPDASPQSSKNPAKSWGGDSKGWQERPASTVAHDPVKKLGNSSIEGDSISQGDPPWDYFGMHHPIDRQFSVQQGHEAINGSGRVVDDRKSKEVEKGVLDTEDEEEEDCFPSAEGSWETGDEFTPTERLSGRFGNVNGASGEYEVSPSHCPTSTTETETEFFSRDKFESPFLTPVRDAASIVDVEKAPATADSNENKDNPYDFISSIKEIEFFFVRASEAGKEVLMLLGAEKTNLLPEFTGPGKKGERAPLSCLTTCFTCEEDHELIEEETPETAAKYLTWHRTASSRSSPSRDPLALNSKPTIEGLGLYRFENFCMVSGNHSSALDRLYAWERKLYDEVKASGVIRRKYDLMCKVLRDEESREAHSSKVYKTRAVIKDLHSRIRVAIQRIDLVSKKIEELRDTELEPQLEELIERLRRMWEIMFECHNRQVHIISAAYAYSYPKVAVGSDLCRQITLHLENELNSLSSSFTKWISSQRFYVQSLNNWLSKCVLIPQKTSKRKRKAHAPSIKELGPPPIYITCADWWGILESLPTKEVKDSIKAIAAETSGFLPRQEKSHGQTRKWLYSIFSNAKGSDPDAGLSKQEPPEETTLRFDPFRSALTSVLASLNSYAQDSVKKYAELQKVLQEAKSDRDHFKR